MVILNKKNLRYSLSVTPMLVLFGLCSNGFWGASVAPEIKQNQATQIAEILITGMLDQEKVAEILTTGIENEQKRKEILEAAASIDLTDEGTKQITEMLKNAIKTDKIEGILEALQKIQNEADAGLESETAKAADAGAAADEVATGGASTPPPVPTAGPKAPAAPAAVPAKAADAGADAAAAAGSKAPADAAAAGSKAPATVSPASLEEAKAAAAVPAKAGAVLPAGPKAADAVATADAAAAPKAPTPPAVPAKAGAVVEAEEAAAGGGATAGVAPATTPAPAPKKKNKKPQEEKSKAEAALRTANFLEALEVRSRDLSSESPEDKISNAISGLESELSKLSKEEKNLFIEQAKDEPKLNEAIRVYEKKEEIKTTSNVVKLKELLPDTLKTVLDNKINSAISDRAEKLVFGLGQIIPSSVLSWFTSAALNPQWQATKLFSSWSFAPMHQFIFGNSIDSAVSDLKTNLFKNS